MGALATATFFPNAVDILPDVVRFARAVDPEELLSDDSEDVMEELRDDTTLPALRKRLVIVKGTGCCRNAFTADVAFVATEARLRDEVDVGVGEGVPVALNLTFTG